MNTTQKRKAPPEHAREFSLGERKRGNDGNMWEIIQTKKGVKRWNKLGARLSSSRVRSSRRSRRRKTRQRHRKKRKTKKVDRKKSSSQKGKTYSIHDGIRKIICLKYES